LFLFWAIIVPITKTTFLIGTLSQCRRLRKLVTWWQGS